MRAWDKSIGTSQEKYKNIGFANLLQAVTQWFVREASEGFHCNANFFHPSDDLSGSGSLAH
jgi:hypothetical protein